MKLLGNLTITACVWLGNNCGHCLKSVLCVFMVSSLCKIWGCPDVVSFAWTHSLRLACLSRRARGSDRWKCINFFKCSKHAVGHVTRINQSAPQGLLPPFRPRTSQHLVERSAKLKMEERLTRLIQGYLALSWRYISSEL